MTNEQQKYFQEKCNINNKKIIKTNSRIFYELIKLSITLSKIHMNEGEGGYKKREYIFLNFSKPFKFFHNFEISKKNGKTMKWIEFN